MNKVGILIKTARKQEGLTQKQLADKIGVPVTTLATWEQGKANPKIPQMTLLMQTLDIKFEKSDPIVKLAEEWFGYAQDDYIGMDMSGDKPKNPTVSVVGYVGAGGTITPIDDHSHGAGLDEVEVPPTTLKGTVAVIVRGDSMEPVLMTGMIIYYSKRVKNIPDHIGRMVVVHFDDGRKAVKFLQHGSKRGIYNLTSSNAPVIKDVKIESVSPIDWIKMS